MPSSRLARCGMRGVLSGAVPSLRILVPAPPRDRFSQSMSLYRAEQRLASSYPSALPRAAIIGTSGFTDVSPVFTSLLRVKATHFLESNPRPQALRSRTYMLSRSLILVARYPSGREDVRPAQERFNEPALSTPDSRACERVPRVWMHKHMPVGG